MAVPKASLSTVASRLRAAAQTLSPSERAALQEAIRATRRLLATGRPEDVKSLVRKLEQISGRPAVKQALTKLQRQGLGGLDSRSLLRVLEQAATRYARGR